MTTTLITGGNKGLGFESARQLAALGHTVYLGARDESRGRTAADELGVRFVQLDVTDQASVDAAIETITNEAGVLDVLINNAGILGRRSTPAEVEASDLEHVYATNVFGVVRLTHAALPLLEKSGNPIIVNVSSGLGALAEAADPTSFAAQFPALTYGSSKSALLMITIQYARALPAMRINAIDPGYTATDFNGHEGTQTVEEGAEAIVTFATIHQSGPTGTFQNKDGIVAW